MCEHIEGTPVRLHVEVFDKRSRLDIAGEVTTLGDLADSIEGLIEVPPLERHSYPVSNPPHENQASWAFEFVFRSERDGKGRYNEMLEIGWITGRLNVPFSTLIEFWEV